MNGGMSVCVRYVLARRTSHSPSSAVPFGDASWRRGDDVCDEEGDEENDGKGRGKDEENKENEKNDNKIKEINCLFDMYLWMNFKNEWKETCKSLKL